MHPILLDFGTIEIGGTTVPIVIGGYGAMFALAVVFGWLLLVHLGRQIDPRVSWTDVAFVLGLSGFVGAKVANAVVFLPDIIDGRRSLLGTLAGGGVWLGGVIVGLVALWVVIRRHRLRAGLVVNAVFVVIPFAHATGRIGCFLAGCCYGSVCRLPWAVTYTDPVAHELNGTPLGVPLHPTVLYEAALEMANFGICYALWRRRAADWAIFAVWTALYGIQRFFLEFFRSDPRGGVGILSTSQWIATGMVAVAAILLLFMRGRRGRLLR